MLKFYLKRNLNFAIFCCKLLMSSQATPDRIYNWAGAQRFLLVCMCAKQKPQISMRIRRIWQIVWPQLLKETIVHLNVLCVAVKWLLVLQFRAVDMLVFSDNWTHWYYLQNRISLSHWLGRWSVLYSEPSLQRHILFPKDVAIKMNLLL